MKLETDFTITTTSTIAKIISAKLLFNTNKSAKSCPRVGFPTAVRLCKYDVYPLPNVQQAATISMVRGQGKVKRNSISAALVGMDQEVFIL